MKKLALTLATAAALAACGGNGSSDDPRTPDTPPPQTQAPVIGTETGILSDAEVAGVTYVTSSGVTGVTDAEGKYQFNPGDTVRFSIGAAVLGEVPAKGLLTPIDLATGDDTKLINLLVMLQSLDADGDPSNGISIPEAAAKAMPTADLTASTSTLTASIRTAMDAGGIQGEVKTPEQAKEHFADQATVLLSKNIWVYTVTDSQGRAVPTMLMRVRPDGEYLFGEMAEKDEGGQSGIEYGKVKVNGFGKNGFDIRALSADEFTGGIDTNGDWGLSDMQDGETFTIGDTSFAVNPPAADQSESPVVFNKVENVPFGIAGAWVLADDSEVGGVLPAKAHTMLFLRSGYMMLLDPIGGAEDECGDPNAQGTLSSPKPGLEVGVFNYTGTDKKFVRKVAKVVDTNGCVGMWGDSDYDRDVEYNLTFSEDGNRVTFKDVLEDDGEFTLVRVSR